MRDQPEAIFPHDLRSRIRSNVRQPDNIRIRGSSSVLLNVQQNLQVHDLRVSGKDKTKSFDSLWNFFRRAHVVYTYTCARFHICLIARLHEGRLLNLPTRGLFEPQVRSVSANSTDSPRMHTKMTNQTECVHTLEAPRTNLKESPVVSRANKRLERKAGYMLVTLLVAVQVLIEPNLCFGRTSVRFKLLMVQRSKLQPFCNYRHAVSWAHMLGVSPDSTSNTSSKVTFPFHRKTKQMNV